ncbi:relaxase/mobilization nuclease domain-containing protein [Streptomyces albiaxialis]|uniref:Relaxase/mobilization nuclease domain-containing protein n=1 Tax=Streptomyces albiaxialis TaxID=329523 RepID=A0ABN2X807_9ACTN
MIPHKAKGGSRTAGLVYYLYGPGKRDEHTNPHLVAAWDDGIIASRDPGRVEGATVPALARLLDAPVEAMDGKPPKQHVYHVPVRLDPGDRELSDAEWNHVAREIMDAAGIAPMDNPARSCRWIAVRHADDHIHIVATLATAEGRQPNVRRDEPKMQARARELEKQYGLRVLGSGDKTAKKWPTGAELGKAARHGRDEPTRVTLHDRVRQAAASATGEDDFFARLAKAGLRVQKRTAPDGNTTGYSVALPGDRTKEGRAVWYSGSRLAPDLSLPRVRERWTGRDGASPTRPTTRAEAWQQAAACVEQAAAELSRSGDAEGAGIVAALGDVLTTYSADAPRMVRGEIKEAAKAFERAGRAPAVDRASSQARRHLTDATQSLVLGAMMVGGGNETAAAIALMNALALAAVAAYQWHQAKQHRMQAEGAAAAGRHLRAATEITTGAATGGGRGRSSSQSSRNRRSSAQPERYEHVVREALPGRAEEILSDEAWPALATTLEAAGEAGYIPSTVLGEIAAQRELGTAESVAQVLTWRLQGRMQQDSVTPPKTPTATGPKTPKKRPPDRRLGEQSEAQRAAQRGPENRPRGPRR